MAPGRCWSRSRSISTRDCASRRDAEYRGPSLRHGGEPDWRPNSGSGREKVLGRLIDVIGNPIDGGESFSYDGSRNPIHDAAPPLASQSSRRELFRLGPSRSSRRGRRALRDRGRGAQDAARYRELQEIISPLGIDELSADGRLAGGVRNQFAHFFDIVPTLLEVAGILQPTMVDSAKQKPRVLASPIRSRRRTPAHLRAIIRSTSR
jgi:hypothetical protein